MARLSILEYPDPRLRQASDPVDTFDAALEQLVADLSETMYAYASLGLSAPQADVQRQVIVCDASGRGEARRVFINPEITASAARGYVQETCLSVPGRKGLVKRPTRITVRALDTSGAPFTAHLQGLEAVCVNHEMDHLQGILFIDRLWLPRRLGIRARTALQQRRAG